MKAIPWALFAAWMVSALASWYWMDRANGFERELVRCREKAMTDEWHAFHGDSLVWHKLPGSENVYYLDPWSGGKR